MLLMYTNPEDTLKMSKQEIQEIELKHKMLLNDLKQKNQILSGSGLLLPNDTKTIHVNDDAIDGPLPVVDPRKQMTGYYIVECKTEQEALGVARAILDYHVTDIEVRGIHNTVSQMLNGNTL